MFFFEIKMLQSFGPLYRQYFIVIIMNLSVLASGLGLAWPSPVLVKLSNETQSVLREPLSEEQGSWVVSIGYLTGLAANLVAPFMVDRIGRKHAIFVPCLLRSTVGFIFLFARELWMLLLGRALQGAADAMIFTVLPMYASEVASKEVRGSVGTVLQVMCSLGVLTMLCVGPYSSYVTLNVVFTVVLVATTVPLAFLPDSPYFLYSKGRDEEALKVLTFFRGSEAAAREELKEYSASRSAGGASALAVVRGRPFLKAFALVLVMNSGLQLCGFNMVSFYLQTILESTRSSVRPEAASAVFGVVQLLASFCTVAVTDRFGRKPILTTTLAGLALGMVGMGAFFHVSQSGPVSGALNYLPLLSLILINFSYSAGLGSISWVLAAELFEDRARGTGLAVTGLWSYVALFLCTKYFPLLVASAGAATAYYLFGLNCVLFCLFVLLCVPETKGKTFSEIQEALGAKPRPTAKPDVPPPDVEKSRF